MNKEIVKKNDMVTQWAAQNCPYKKFKWHTEEMCDNCRKVASELKEILAKESDERVIEAARRCRDLASITDKVGFGLLGFLAGTRDKVKKYLNAAAEIIEEDI